MLSLQSFEAIFLASASPVAILCPNAPNFTVIRVNHAWKELWGLEQDAIVPESLAELYAAAGASLPDTISASLAKVLETSAIHKLSSPVPLSIPALGGTHRYRIEHVPILNKQGKIECIMHSLIEVPGTMDSFALSGSDGHADVSFLRMIENMPGAVYTCDTQGRILYYNEAAVALWGRKPDAETDRWCGSVKMYDMDGAPVPHDACPMAAVLQTSCLPSAKELQIERPDGSRSFVLAHPVSVRDNKGHIIGALNMFVDISGRVATVEKLRQNEERLKSILESEPECVKIVSRSGELQEMNPAGLRMLDAVHEEEVINKQILDFVHPEDREVYKSLHDKACSGHSGTVRFRITGLKGSHRWIESHSVPLRNNQKEAHAVLSVSRDVTEKIEAEQELKQSREQLQKIMDQSPDIICTLDEQGSFVKIGAACHKILSYSPEELAGKPFIDYVMEEDQARAQTALQEILSGIQTTSLEIRAIHKSGAFVPLICSAKWDAGDKLLYCVARDATELKKQEMELRLSNERFHYVTRATSDAVWDWDIEKGKVYWGEGYETLFGYPIKNKFVSENLWKEKIHPEDYERVWSSILKTRKNKTAHSWSGEYRFRRADGTYAFVREKSVILRNSSGKPIRMIGALQDISRMRETEERLARERNMLRAIIDNIPEYIFVKDREGRHLVINTKLYRDLYGVEAEQDVIGKTDFDLFDSHIARLYAADDRSVIETGRPVLNRQEYTIDKKGNKLWTLTTKVPLRNQSNDIIGLVGISRDITESYNRNLEQELISNIIKLLYSSDSLQESLTSALKLLAQHLGFHTSEAWIVDEDGEKLSLRAVWVEQGETDMLNSDQEVKLSKDEGLPGHTLARKEIVLWHDLKNTEEFIRKKALGKTELNFAIGIPIMLNGQVNAVFILFNEEAPTNLDFVKRMLTQVTLQIGLDIERKKAQEGIRIAKERYEIVSKATNDAIWDWDITNNRLYWGEGFKTLFGHETEEEFVPIESWVADIHPEDTEWVTNSLMEAIHSANVLQWEEEYRYRRFDGTYAHVLDRGFIIRDADLKAIRMIGALQDITSLKEKEKQLRDSLKEKETLLAEIHHRVKNNLAVVSGMMQLQAFKESDLGIRYKLMDSVTRIGSMAAIHEQLYKANSFSRLDLAENLKNLIANVIKTIQSVADIQLDFHLEPVQLNVNQAIPFSLIINEVVTNIIKHAFKDRRQGKINVELSERNEQVHLAIEDDGVGLPRDFDLQQKATLGIQLIVTLSQQLDARYEYRSNGMGCRFMLAFKKSEVKGIGNAHLM